MRILPSVRDANVIGRKVLLRLDLNLPVSEGRILDDFRLRRALPMIEWLHERKAKIVIATHFASNSPLDFNLIRELLSTHLSPDDILLDNLRIDPREEVADDSFARALSLRADIFVNDAFSASHRAHASIVGIPKFLPSFAGISFLDEYEELSKTFEAPRPFVVILGGAKFTTKLPLIQKFLTLADEIHIVGALANDLLRVSGHGIGKSLSDPSVDISNLIKNQKIIAPVDVQVTGPTGKRITSVGSVMSDEIIKDVGPATVSNIKNAVARAKFILWNGPLGQYEQGFIGTTEDVARAIVLNTEAYSIVGGGDTLACIRRLGLEYDFGFASTAGGAMLDFLATGTLPGIEALLQNTQDYLV